MLESNNKFIGCDLFSGAGGLSLGAQQAGISVKIAVESDKFSAQTFRHNHPDISLLESDIRETQPSEHFEKNPFILFGGPPCQGFSLSNTLTRNTENKNNSLFEEFIRYVRILEPEWFLFENVEGIVSFLKGEVIFQLKNQLEKLGYRTFENVLTASDYGVPQNRNRYFLIGNKKRKSFKFPNKTKSIVSVSDALSDLPDLNNGDWFESLPYKGKANNKYASKMRGHSKKSKQNFVSRNQDYVIERYSYIKPGENWKSIPDSLMGNYKNKSNCHSGIYKRLDPSKPSVVISNYRKNMLIHPYQDRGLSVREAARLQSFPDKFLFHGPLMYKQQQIGNAVPPLLAKSIFQRILATD